MNDSLLVGSRRTGSYLVFSFSNSETIAQLVSLDVQCVVEVSIIVFLVQTSSNQLFQVEFLVINHFVTSRFSLSHSYNRSEVSLVTYSFQRLLVSDEEFSLVNYIVIYTNIRRSDDYVAFAFVNSITLQSSLQGNRIHLVERIAIAGVRSVKTTELEVNRTLFYVSHGSAFNLKQVRSGYVRAGSDNFYLTVDILIVSVVEVEAGRIEVITCSSEGSGRILSRHEVCVHTVVTAHVNFHFCRCTIRIFIRDGFNILVFVEKVIFLIELAHITIFE